MKVTTIYFSATYTTKRVVEAVAASKFDPARVVLVAVIRDNHGPC